MVVQFPGWNVYGYTPLVIRMHFSVRPSAFVPDVVALVVLALAWQVSVGDRPQLVEKEMAGMRCCWIGSRT